jgi:hypothetical protein
VRLGIIAVTHRGVPFDVDAVVSDLRRRRHPNAEFASAILTGQRQSRNTSSWNHFQVRGIPTSRTTDGA